MRATSWYIAVSDFDGNSISGSPIYQAQVRVAFSVISSIVNFGIVPKLALEFDRSSFETECKKK